jgi:predicted DNA-binding transcriptional regulator AlpA
MEKQNATAVDQLAERLLDEISVVANDRWLDAVGVGHVLSYDPRVVRERLSLLDDFPRPLRIDGVGFPRWLYSEVMEWAKKQRQKCRQGRPRH